MANAKQIREDAKLIQSYGGPAKVAEMLHLDKKRGGVQRVHNWMSRGIPPKVKLENPTLFLLPSSAKRESRKPLDARKELS